MFLKKSHVDELVSAVESNLISLKGQNLTKYQQRKNDVLCYLETAANLFDEVELEKEASVITTLMMKLAEYDPAINGLTSDKMLHNLEDNGWVFNQPSETPLAINGTIRPSPQAGDHAFADDLEVEDLPQDEDPEELLHNNPELLGHPDFD